jgi:hypothetical protein
MKTEKAHLKKNRPLTHEPLFGGTVEFIPVPRTMMEFITHDGLWGFPTGKLNRFMLGKNPDHRKKSTRPPDQLSLFYSSAIVVLRGWRLELMVTPLLNGRVARVHAEKYLGILIIEEPWVSEIHVIPFDGDYMSANTLRAQIKAGL